MMDRPGEGVSGRRKRTESFKQHILGTLQVAS